LCPYRKRPCSLHRKPLQEATCETQQRYAVGKVFSHPVFVQRLMENFVNEETVSREELALKMDTILDLLEMEDPDATACSGTG
jgi:hypothetical protein